MHENNHETLPCLISFNILVSRDNKIKILEILRDTWAKDRKAEWSIWMVYSKVEMPHHYINSESDESYHRAANKRLSSIWKPDEVGTLLFLVKLILVQIT